VRHPIQRLLEVGAPGGPPLDEALKLFADLRSTHEEGRAIHQLLVRNQSEALPEPLLVSVASALVDRGEDEAAASILALASSLPALVLRADLRERAGDMAGAIALIERVLFRDIDWPGARERHARWRRVLGGAHQRAVSEPTSGWMEALPGVPFRLLREAARGGAGVVYEAEDRDLGRRVALKVYHRPARDRLQLLHEAQVAVALAGEGIVRVFDVDPEHGWLALEWALLGTLLGPLQRGEPWVRRDIERWAKPLARALARVHAGGWVHHDVKPANILFRAIDAPLLTDFGTARRQGAPAPPGSLGYVSPERLAGRLSDPADDVYGFGRVLEDAINGRADPPGDLIAPWRRLAAICTGPCDSRPRDGAELSVCIDGIPSPPGRS
jgi:hypothetical protein